MSTPEEEWVLLARVVRPQGRFGEVLCEMHTDFPERFADRRDLWLKREGTEAQPARLESHWLPTGSSAGRVVLKFQGMDTIEAAEAIKGAEVLLPLAERVALGPDEFYISDLQGCTVFNVADGETSEIGVIADVHFATDRNGRKLQNATPVLVVTRRNGDEVLIPLAKEFLHKPDLAERRVEMVLPGGLVEANG